MKLSRRHVAVLGGGISGLAAAHRLVSGDANVELTLYDAEDKLGGVLKTEESAQRHISSAVRS